jgi:hypothetical protein
LIGSHRCTGPELGDLLEDALALGVRQLGAGLLHVA